jgi:hypothetical protein
MVRLNFYPIFVIFIVKTISIQKSLVGAFLNQYSIAQIRYVDTEQHFRKYQTVNAGVRNVTGELEIDVILNEIQLCRTKKQQRRKMRHPRRPFAFWKDISNIESELRKFWEDVSVTIDSTKPPPLPSEAILNHFERHDLRYAIANMGGRKFVASKLGDARLIPGKWFDAIKCDEIQQLLLPSNPASAGLCKKFPPPNPTLKRTIENLSHPNDIHALRYQNGERWTHKTTRNPRNYWNSEDVVIAELYHYLSRVKVEQNRPSIWMPRPSELTNAGRDDLKQAITRYGGADHICKTAKLIPYREWRYFESNLELFIELQRYLSKFHTDNDNVFPKLSDIQANEHNRLYDLIMQMGGRKILARQLSMEFQVQSKFKVMQGISLGRFDLCFAIRLMHFIRGELLQEDPPLSRMPTIRMPTVQELLLKGKKQLAKECLKYGGHESIARRLNIAFDIHEAGKEAADLIQKKSTLQ